MFTSDEARDWRRALFGSYADESTLLRFDAPAPARATLRRVFTRHDSASPGR